jgi:hypothetical protein
VREGGCAGLGRLKRTVYAPMEEMSFCSGAAVALGLLRHHHHLSRADELTMYA